MIDKKLIKKTNDFLAEIMDEDLYCVRGDIPAKPGGTGEGDWVTVEIYIKRKAKNVARQD